MSDFISRDDLLNELAKHHSKTEDGRTLYHPSMVLAMEDVRRAPAVDLTEMLGCAGCKYYHKRG